MREARLISRFVTAAFVLVLSAAGIVSTVDAAPQQSSPREAQGSWWDRAPVRRIGHYWFKSDLPPDELRDLAIHMNRMYEEYSKRLAHLPMREREKLNVMIFAKRQDYLDTLRTRFGIDGTGSGGMFIPHPDVAALALWTEGLPRRRIEHVMQHEGFHQFADSRFGGDLPIWANEGLAEFFGRSVLVDGKLVIGQATQRVIDTIRAATDDDRHIPFREMLTMTSARWGEALRNGDAGLQYDQAWSMVHFLVYGDDGKYRRAFDQYLRYINNALPSDVAFIRAFGSDDFDAFEARWKAYALQARPSAFMTSLERIEFLAEGVLAIQDSRLIDDGDGATPPYPQTLDELREALREIDFEQKVNMHGVERTLRAADDGVYEIPMDDLAREQPVFVLEAPKRRRLPLREQRLEEANPTPPTIRTEHLEPNDIIVRWVRDEETNTFSYELDIK